MALVTKEITSLTGGVSRQPYDSRNPAQVEEATNTLFDPADGATKRPPSEYQGSTSNISRSSVRHVHTYNRDSYERYNVVINNESGTNTVRVFRATDGLEYNVTQTGTYLDQGNGTDFQMLTLGDTTIVTNKDVGVSMENAVTDKDSLRAIFALNRPPTSADGSSAPNLYWVDGYNSEGLMWSVPIAKEDFGAGGPDGLDPWDGYGQQTMQTKVSEYLRKFSLHWNRVGVPRQQTTRWIHNANGLQEAARIFTGDTYWAANPQSAWAIQQYNLGANLPLLYVSPTPSTTLGQQNDNEIYPMNSQWYNATDHGAVYGVLSADQASQQVIYPGNDQTYGYNYNLYAYSNAWYWHPPNGSEQYILGEYSYTDSSLLNPNTPDTNWNVVDGLPATLNGEPNPYRDEILKCEIGSAGVMFTNLAGPRVEQLPADCEDGFRTRMQGDETVDSDDYYLVFQKDLGAWVETRAPEIVHDFDQTTMPHVLNRILDNTDPNGIRFEFGPANAGNTNFNGRLVGDEKSAPQPSFVGQKITGLTYFKGRLGLISAGSVVLSEVNQPFNMWPTSVMTLKNSDAVDLEVALGEGNVSNLFSGTATEAGLVLYDRFSQHLLRAEDGQAFGPRTASIDTISRYPVSEDANPQFIGDKIFWPTDTSVSSKFWEYSLERSGGEAVDIAAHVDQYLPSGFGHVCGSRNHNMITGWSDSEPSSLYIYNFMFGDRTRLQAAWSKWTFGGELIHTYFIDDDLYLLIERDGVVNVEKIDVSNPTGAAGFPVCLDSRIKITPSAGFYQATYVSSQNNTIFTRVNPAYSNSTQNYDMTTKVIVAGENTPWPGRIFEGTAAGNQVLVSGNLIPNGDEVFYFGESYTQSIELSRFILASERTQYREAKTYSDGRTQLKTLAVSFSEAGPFSISHNVGGDVYEQSHTPELIDSGFSDPPLSYDGIFKTDIGGRNTETTTTFTNTSPIPTTITGLRYEVQYHTRGNRGGRF